MAPNLSRRIRARAAQQGGALRYGALYALLCLASAAACAPLSLAPTPAVTPSPAPLRVYADAALANVLRDIGTAFTQAHGGADIEWAFVPPGAFHEKLAEGPAPDVIVSADAELMQNSAGSARQSVARDPLVIVTAVSNPARVERLEDLNRADLRVAIAAEHTAPGQATRALVDNFRHDAMFGPDFPATFYANVIAQPTDARAILNLVLEQRADIGIVPASEAEMQAERVTVFAIPDGLQVFANYASAVTAPNDSALAHAFVKYLGSPQAQTLWRDYGFEPTR